MMRTSSLLATLFVMVMSGVGTAGAESSKTKPRPAAADLVDAVAHKTPKTQPVKVTKKSVAAEPKMIMRLIPDKKKPAAAAPKTAVAPVAPKTAVAPTASPVSTAAPVQAAPTAAAVAKPLTPSTAPAPLAPVASTAPTTAPTAIGPTTAPAVVAPTTSPAVAAPTTPPAAVTPTVAPTEPAAPPMAVASARTGGLDKTFMLGVHAGMGIPQLFSKLRNFGVYELEFGFLIPTWGRRFQIGGMFSYSSPGSGNGKPDPRLGGTGGADYRWDLSNREYVLELNFTLRGFPLGSRFNAYGKAGFRVYLLDTEIDGTASGSTFGVYNETFTEPGFMVGGGLEFRLGPGAFNAELRIDFSNMNRLVSGDSNTGMLTLVVGYRVFL